MPALSLANLAVPLGLEPMEAKLVSELPEASGWQFEPEMGRLPLSRLSRRHGGRPQGEVGQAARPLLS